MKAFCPLGLVNWKGHGVSTQGFLRSNLRFGAGRGPVMYPNSYIKKGIGSSLLRHIVDLFRYHFRLFTCVIFDSFEFLTFERTESRRPFLFLHSSYFYCELIIAKVKKWRKERREDCRNISRAMQWIWGSECIWVRISWNKQIWFRAFFLIWGLRRFFEELCLHIANYA